MKALTLVAALCLACLGSVAARQSPSKNRPVSKVLLLLKDMQAQLAKEQETDQSVYDNLQCWCDTNDQAKTKAIEEAESRIAELTTKVEGHTADISRLQQEIANLEKEIAANQQALAEALAIREKERAAFAAAEKEMGSATVALKSAISVLSKHHAPPKQALLNIATMLSSTMHKYQSTVAKALDHKQRRVVQSFIQQPGYIGATPTFKQAYGSQSGEIFGILNNMLDTFLGDAKASQAEEASKEAAYQAVKAAKSNEISAAEDAKATKRGQLANTQEALANAKQDIEDTRNSLGADQVYLMDLKAKCQQTNEEWTQRQKTRGEELESVSKAIAVLSADDAHDLFTRTFNSEAPTSSFLQTRVRSNKRSRAAELLRSVARRFPSDPHAAQLVQTAAAVAAASGLDAFERVKASIDGLVSQLLKEKQDEIKHRDWCNAELNQSARQAELKNRDKSDLEIKIEELTSQIDSLAKAVAVLEAEIADLQKQVQQAGEDREKENMDFQATVKDAQATQKLLAQAVEVLGSFYGKPALIARQPAGLVGPPPPKGFDSYKKQGGSGVVALLQAIHKDAQNLEKEAIQAEQDSQAAYETFVRDSNGSIEAKQRDITNKQENKAQAEADLTAAKEDASSVTSELASLADYAAKVHASCDFVVKNFDVRQAARDQEVEALRQAKAILAGMQSS